MAEYDYYHDDVGNEDARLGRAIWKKSFSGRKGLRPDHLRIWEHDDVWLDIFESIGIAAREEVKPR